MTNYSLAFPAEISSVIYPDLSDYYQYVLACVILTEVLSSFFSAGLETAAAEPEPAVPLMGSMG